MATGVKVWSQTAASNASADSAINWAEGQAPSSVNDSARGMMASISKWRDDLNGSIVTGGTSTAYTVATNQGFAALTAGYEVAFQLNADCGATVTLNVDGLGAKPLRSAPAVELVAGALKNGSIHRATYATSNSGEWLLHDINPTIIAADQVVTTSIADESVTYAKIQDVAGSRLLGNATGSAASAAEISLGANMSFSGGALASATDPATLFGYLSGLTLSTAGSSSTFGVAVGVANDTAAAGMMVLASAYTKTTASWAVGSGNGSLDAGSIATNTWYHTFLIKRIDTGVVDVLISTSPTAPTLPANYTLSRRIGSMKTNSSSQWTLFTQIGDEFLWAAPVSDSQATTTSRVSFTLTVPTGVVVMAKFKQYANPGGNLGFLYTSLLETSGGFGVGAADFYTSGGALGAANIERMTNTSAQIGASSNLSATATVNTYAWTDTRGK